MISAGLKFRGIQSWVALPKSDEETPPDFARHPQATLPEVDQPGVHLKIIAGTGFGVRAPVRVHSDTLCVHAELKSGASLTLPAEHIERAHYVVELRDQQSEPYGSSEG